MARQARPRRNAYLLREDRHQGQHLTRTVLMKLYSAWGRAPLTAAPRAGVPVCRGAHAGCGGSTEKIIRQRLASRFVRTSRAHRSWGTRDGSVRSSVRIRQFLRWAKSRSTGTRPTARTCLASSWPGVNLWVRPAVQPVTIKKSRMPLSRPQKPRSALPVRRLVRMEGAVDQDHLPALLGGLPHGTHLRRLPDPLFFEFARFHTARGDPFRQFGLQHAQIRRRPSGRSGQEPASRVLTGSCVGKMRFQHQSPSQQCCRVADPRCRARTQSDSTTGDHMPPPCSAP
jgi:hypothetical protein